MSREVLCLDGEERRGALRDPAVRDRLRAEWESPEATNIIVNGQVYMQNGKYTCATSGHVIRGA